MKMVSEDFKVGDLVWAKMKNYPPWPAKIEAPSSKIKPPKNKKAHFVFFFGSNNYAWILDENISPHNENVLNASMGKKKSQALRDAIEKFIIYSSKIKQEKPSPHKIKKKKAQNDKDSPLKVVNSVEKKMAVHKSPHKGMKRSLFDMNGERKTYSSKSRKLNDYFTPKKVRHSLKTDFLPSHKTSQEIYENTLDRKHVNPSQKKFGFIGLGHMGKVIVRNLLEYGHDVTVWNRSMYKCIPLVELGAKQAQSPAELVVLCDVVFCCVSDPDASKQLIFGNFGILKGLEEVEELGFGRRGYVEMTSIDPETSRGFNEAIAMKHGMYLEAPLCGTSKDAEDGSLLIVASGDRRVFAQCESCFQAIGKHAFYLTCDVGYSTKMTLILSMFTGSLCVSVAEAIVLAEKLNISKERYLELLHFWPLRIEKILSATEKITSDGSSATMPFKLIQKDLNFALIWADKFCQPMRVTAAANEVYKFAKLLEH